MPVASTLPAMFPIPESAKATPRPPAAIPAAPRVVEDNWHVTAATPTQTTPTAPTDAPARNAPSAGCPTMTNADPITRARTRSAATATMTAEARQAYRPITVELSISVRPSSSFWRVCRITAKMLMRAASTARVTNSRWSM
jgi:hypothetical protein